MTTISNAPPHPAKFTPSVLNIIRDVLIDEWGDDVTGRRILDPMAGVGGVHDIASLGCETVGVELEWEWANAHPDTLTGDVLDLPADWAGTFDAVVTSPPYGNRMADHHDAKDDSRRITYKHLLGRDLTPGSGAGMQWSYEYRHWGASVVEAMVVAVKDGGLVILNVSNHIRKAKEVLASEFWLAELLDAGLRIEALIPVRTPRMGFGANAASRVAHEWVFVTRRTA